MRLIELNSMRIEQNLFYPLENWLPLHKTRVYSATSFFFRRF